MVAGVKKLAAPSMRSNTLKRKVTSFPHVDNGIVTFDLPRGYDQQAVVIVLRGNFTIGTAATTASALAPAQLIKRVDIFADGNKQFEQCPGIVAMWANFERKLQRVVTAPGVGAGVQTPKGVWRFDRVTADGLRPKDSALHTSAPYMSLFQARVTMGAISNMFSVPGAFVLSANALTYDVYVEEIEEFLAAGALEGRYVRRCSFQELSIVANNTAFSTRLPIGNYIRGVKLIALDNTLEPTATEINNILLRSGVNVRMDLAYDSLRAQNMADYSLNFIGNGVASNSFTDGFLYADTIEEGSLNSMWDLTRASEAELVLDVTKPGGGNGTVQAQVVEYIWQPPRA